MENKNTEAAWRIAIGILNASDFKNSENFGELAARISREILSDEENFSLDDILKIHKRLFDGICKSAGKLRNKNLTKQLATDIEGSLNFNFDDFKLDDLISHIATFITNLRKNNYFEDGDSITCSVILIDFIKLLNLDYLNFKPFENNGIYYIYALEQGKQKELCLFLDNFIFGTKHNIVNPSISDWKNLTKPEVEVLNLIIDNPEIKQEEISLKVKKSLRTVKSITKTLVEKGLLQRSNGKRYGHWVVLN